MLSPLQPEVVTLGCRLNIAESETIRALLGQRDAVVVNSCAVTNQAVKDTRSAIRRLRRTRPAAELVVTGCAATIDPAGFGAMPEVDRVLPNATKLDPVAWGVTGAPRRRIDQSRAFVAVQNGCDHRCTFCAIPAGRGPSVSRAIDAVVAEVAALAAAGHAEVVLTGVDLTSFTPSLGALVEAIVAHTTIARIRLSSIDGHEVDDRLFALLTQESRVMPHLHLSLQAGDDLILKRMKRRHLRTDAIRLVERIKARRDVAIGADLIAGFPTEEEVMFANTLALLDDCDIVHAHIFPYSARDGTPAARMPQVPHPVRRDRAKRLREAAGARKAGWLARLVGSTQEIVIEQPGDRGHTPHFAELRFSLPVQSTPRPAQSVLPARPERVERRLTIERTGRPSISSGQTERMKILSSTATHLIGTPA